MSFAAISFTNTFTAQAICAPSRSQLFTGNYPLKNGCFANHTATKPNIVSVTTHLKKLGYEVVPQVGVSGFFIDLGIKHKSFKYGYLAGVECDGAAYHSSDSARDNDITRQKVLESKGWNIYRIWSTDWFLDPNKELKKLDYYIKELLKNLT